MFIFGAIGAVGRAGKALCGCICTLVLGGPILIIVGILMLTVENTRKSDVAAYNKVAEEYNTSIGRAMTPAYFSINGGQSRAMSYNTVRVPIEGNTEGVTSALSSLVSGYAPTQSSSFVDTARFTFSLSYNATSFNAEIPTKSTGSESIRCDRVNDCTAATMSDICRSKRGSSASYNGGRCSYRSSCGECRYSAYLSEACVVVSGGEGGAQFVRDSRLASCFYPFDGSVSSYKYGSSTTADIAVTVRHASDPLIALERITKGSRDFGVTEEDQKSVGRAALIIGIVLLLGSVALCVCLFFMVRAVANRGQQPATTELLDGMRPGGYPAQQPMPQQQPYPQQPMPQQQPVYGQPVYGQPMPPPQQPYGQPMPPPQQPYGHPPQQYGQQPMPPHQYGQPMPPQQQPYSPYAQPSCGAQPQY